MPKYGLISEVDAKVLEKTIDLIIDREFIHIPEICVTEIGVWDGATARGIKGYIQSKERHVNYTAIDNSQFFPVKSPFEGCNFIDGESRFVYNQLRDYSQHLIFIDGNHSFQSVVADFFCYADKVHYDGFIAFHDTKPNIERKPHHYQGVGPEDDPDFGIAVRKALKKIGLINDQYKGWVKVFDEYDENTDEGGMCVFQKIYL